MGENSAFQEHLIVHLPKIRNIVRKIAKNEGLVDDITQECCARIIEKEKLWDGNTNKLNQWMNMVSRNLAIDLVIKRKKIPLSRQPFSENTLAYPNIYSFSEDHIRWVLKQFNTLPKMQKEVLKLKYFKQMKSIDIAKQLGITQQAVCIHLSRSINTLKKRAKIQEILPIFVCYLKRPLWLNTFVNIVTNRTRVFTNSFSTPVFLNICSIAFFGLWISSSDTNNQMKTSFAGVSKTKKISMQLPSTSNQISKNNQKINTAHTKMINSNLRLSDLFLKWQLDGKITLIIDSEIKVNKEINKAYAHMSPEKALFQLAEEYQCALIDTGDYLYFGYLRNKKKSVDEYKKLISIFSDAKQNSNVIASNKTTSGIKPFNDDFINKGEKKLLVNN